MNMVKGLIFLFVCIENAVEVDASSKQVLYPRSDNSDVVDRSILWVSLDLTDALHGNHARVHAT